MPGIKVKVLVTSNWAINPPNPGELYIIEGEVRDDIPKKLIDRMLDCDTDYIQVLELGSPHESDKIPESPHVLDDVSEVRATLMEIAENADNKNDAKDKLEAWARENLGYEVDKRRGLDKVIANIITEYEVQNG